MTAQKYIRWVTLAALFLIPLIPIIPGVAIANNLFFPFITGKNFAFRILVEVAFAGWVLLALMDKRYRPRFSWTFVLFAAFVVWMAIADAFAVNPMKAFWSNFERMDGWVELIHVFLLFVVAGSVLAVDKLWRRWWETFVAVAAVICGYGFLQAAGVLAIHQGSTRIDATFGNSDYLAAYMLFALVATLWIAFHTDRSRKWVRYCLYVLAVLEVITLFLTETRGAILGLVGAAGLGIVLWMIGAGTRGRKAAAGLLIVLLILVGGFFLLRNQAWVQKVPGLDRVASISLSDPETTARFYIWNMAWHGFLARPITGWGQEGFIYVFNTYFEPQLYGQEPWFDRAHDVFLDWLTAGGAPALILFVALLAAAVIALYRTEELSRTERILFISALAAYVVQGIFVFDNLFTYVPLALILALAHGVSSRPYAKLENLPTPSDAQFQTFAVPIGVIALALVIWFVNVPGLRAASDLIVALTPSADPASNLTAFKQAYADGSFANQEITEQLMTFLTDTVQDPSVSDTDKQAIASYAIQQMNQLVSQIPHDARIRLEYAYGLRAVGDFQDALTQIHIAEQLSPQKQILYIEEGIEQWQSGNPTAAKAAFDKAYSFDTSITDLVPYVAAGDIITGDTQDGKSLLQQTFSTTTADNDVLVLAYYTAKDMPDLIAIWQLRVNESHSAEAEFGLAAAYADAGQLATARAEIQEAIKEHPEDASEGAAYLQQIANSPAAQAAGQ